MRQTKESNKCAPGRVVIYISVHLVSIYTLTVSNVLLVLALNLIVHKSSYCKCSLAWCQSRTFLSFTIWTHPLQMRDHPLQYASTDKNKKSHYSITGVGGGASFFVFLEVIFTIRTGLHVCALSVSTNQALGVGLVLAESTVNQCTCMEM